MTTAGTVDMAGTVAAVEEGITPRYKATGRSVAVELLERIKALHSNPRSGRQVLTCADHLRSNLTPHGGCSY